MFRLQSRTHHLPEPARPPLCPGSSGQTWHGNVQTAVDFHPAELNAVPVRFSLGLEEPGLQNSRGFYPSCHPPAQTLHRSVTTRADEQPADMSLQPENKTHITSSDMCLLRSCPTWGLENLVSGAHTSMKGSWQYSFRRFRTTKSPIAPKASPTNTE